MLFGKQMFSSILHTWIRIPDVFVVLIQLVDTHIHDFLRLCRCSIPVSHLQVHLCQETFSRTECRLPCLLLGWIEWSKSYLGILQVVYNLLVSLRLGISRKRYVRRIECSFRVKRNATKRFHKIEVEQRPKEFRLTDVFILYCITQIPGLELIDQRVGPVDPK